MSKLKISANDVIQAFRVVLGRVPESQEAINAHMSLESLESLGSTLMQSQEFKAKFLQAQYLDSKWVVTSVLERYLMWVDLHDRYVSHGCLNDNWEPSETDFFVSRLREGDTVLDIGANIGWFSLVASKHIGPTGSIHSFEPRPQTSKMLAKTISLNGLRSMVHCWEYALTDEPGNIFINWGVDTDNPGGSFISKTFNPVQSGLQSSVIKAVRLDDFLPDIKPDVIKIDVEGAGPLVFFGAVNALRRGKPVILSELYPEQLMRVSGHTSSSYISQMHELGYVCYMLENGRPTSRLTDFISLPGRDLISCVFEWRGNNF